MPSIRMPDSMCIALRYRGESPIAGGPSPSDQPEEPLPDVLFWNVFETMNDAARALLDDTHHRLPTKKLVQNKPAIQEDLVNKTLIGPSPASKLADPVTTSSWPLLAMALVASGGLSGPALAADPVTDGQNVRPAQATGSAASQSSASAQPSPSAQTGSSQLTPTDIQMAQAVGQGAPQSTMGDGLASPSAQTGFSQPVLPDIQLAQAAGQGALQSAIGSGQPSPSAQTGPSQPTPPVAGVGGGGGGAATYSINPSPAASKNPYALADSLKYRGWIVPLPGALDTADQGLFGVRNALAENGISYFGFSTSTFQDNIIRHGLPAGNQFGPHSRDNQSYAGQLPTYTTANTIFLMYDLTRYGIPDGQISLAGSLLQTNWQPGDPNGINLGQLSYYQTAFNRLLEIKVGYLTNNLEYLGTQIGGNIGAGLFGVSAAIPFEEGQNLGSFPTPSANVKVNLPDHFYTKLGVQRATSPDGLQAERLENPTSVRFVGPNDGVFVIDETGYRVNAAPGQMSTWCPRCRQLHLEPVHQLLDRRADATQLRTLSPRRSPDHKDRTERRPPCSLPGPLCRLLGDVWPRLHQRVQPVL